MERLAQTRRQEILEERRERTILLLQSRLAWHPTPGRTEVRGAVSGFAHGVLVRESCPDCLTNGFASRDCETCKGHGFVEVRRDHDPYAVEKVQPYGIDPTKHDRTHDRDAQIDRLASQLAPPLTMADELAAANEHPYPWERERDRYMRAGDYHALDKALEWLAAQNVEARDLVAWVWESGAFELGCLDETILNAAQLAVDLLTPRMPDPIKVPHWLLPSGRDRNARRRAA